MNEKIGVIIATHQKFSQVEKMVSYWCRFVPKESLFLAYGGVTDEYKKIENLVPNSAYIDDERLRVKDQQREAQSYAKLFQTVSESSFLVGFEYVLFTEFDQIPLQPNFLDLYKECLLKEDADVLFFALGRVDGTNSPHWLNHQQKPGFLKFMEALSCRAEKQPGFSATGFGHFWKCEAFNAVARVEDTVQVYAEIWIPTVAHHLGFRIRPLPAKLQEVNHTLVPPSETEEELIAKGVWAYHPNKTKWN